VCREHTPVDETGRGRRLMWTCGRRRTINLFGGWGRIRTAGDVAERVRTPASWDTTMERALAFIKVDSQVLPGEEWRTSAPWTVSRAKIPGGWLVVVEGGTLRSWGLTFVPDINHEWDGGSVE